MADSELGELRRPPRLPEQRIHRLASWRAQGLAGGTSDDVTPADAVDDVLASDGGGEGDGGDPPSWFADSFDITSATTSPLTLTYIPLPYSEVVRINGITLEPTVDYTIDGSSLALTDLADLRLGIGADTWTLVASYAYVDAAEPTPGLAFVYDITDDNSPNDALEGGEVGFLFVSGATSAVSGYFETWEKVDDGGAGTDGEDTTTDVWRGTGTSMTGSVSTTGGIAGIVLVVFRDADPSLVSIERLTATDYDITEVPTTVTIGTSGIAEGDMVFTTMRGKNNFVGRCKPDLASTFVSTGFDATAVSSGTGGTFGKGLGLCVGEATATTISTDFPMDEVDGYGQAVVFRLTVG